MFCSTSGRSVAEVSSFNSYSVNKAERSLSETQPPDPQRQLRHSASETSLSSAFTGTVRGGEDPMVCDSTDEGGYAVPETFHPFTSSFSSMTSRHAEVDVIRKADHYEVHMDLAGYKPENVCLQLRQRVVHVCVTSAFGIEGRECSYSAATSCRQGTFHSTVRLPHDVDPERVSADMAYGMLRLRLPRGSFSGVDGQNSSMVPSFHDEMALRSAGRPQPIHVERLSW